MDLMDRIRGAVSPYDARVGVTDCAPFPEVRAEMDRRIASGERGSLGFVYKDPARASDPSISFPWASSIVVAAAPYLRDGDGPGPGRAIARFADGDRYEGLRTVLSSIEGVLADARWRTEIVYDDDRLVDRAVAARAGVAWNGKSTMALTPGLGPWFLIGSVVTDAPLDATEPMQRTCGSCVACIPACPTGAIVAPGVLDARRCLAAVLQGRGAIDPDLRPAVGGRVYGCDECLTACPPGAVALTSHAPGRTPGAVDVLAMSDAEIDATFAHWYIPGRNPRFIRRNALVAVGNTGSTSDIPLLARFARSPDALLRSHAVWALGRIGGAQARSVVAGLVPTERDPDVIAEIDAVVAG